MPTPSRTAFSKPASSRSSSRMLADLPPSSSATRLTRARRRAAATRLPARVEPVKRHHVDVGVRGDGLADHRADAGDEVEHAGRQPDVVDDLGEDERVERRDLARLEHDGAAGGQRVGDLGRDLVQRVVPRRDAADDADRLPHDEASCRPAPRTGNSSASAARRAERADRQAGLDQLASDFGMPDLAGDDRRRSRPCGAEALGDAAAGTWPAPPVAVAAQPVERGAGGLAAAGRRPRRCPSGTRPMTSSVAESMTSIVPVPVDGTHAPSM